MANILLFIFLILAKPAFAEWVIVSDDSLGNKFYIDFSSVKINKNIITAWTYQDFAKENEFGDLSSRSLTEYDCKINKFRILRVLTYDKKRMGGNKTSNLVTPGNWMTSEPSSIITATFNPWCQK